MSMVAKLGDVAPAKPLKKSDASPEEMVWHLNLDQIESDSGRVLEEIVAPVVDANNSTHWFDERHVLYSKLRPYLNKVVVPGKQGIATTELVPMMPDPTRLKRKYLAHYLRSKKFVSWISSQVAGAKMPRVSMKVFWGHEIPLPPLEEQKRIAAILDNADAIRRKRQAAIKLVDEFLRATFLDMFGDPVTNPKNLPVAPFENMVKNLIRGPFGGALKKEIFVPAGYKVYEQKHAILGNFTVGSYYISKHKYEEMSRFSLSAGDLIVSCSGTIGRVAIVPESAKPGIINQALLKIETDEAKASAVYLKAILESASVQKILYGFSRGSGLKNFPPMGEIRALPIPVPTSKQLEKYHQFLTKYFSNNAKILHLLDESKALFSSLTQRAFQGEL